MIRRILKFRLQLWPFLRGVPEFLRQYAATRVFRDLLVSLPVLLVSVLLTYCWVSAGPKHETQLLRRYESLTANAVNDQGLERAEVYFARQLQLTDDREQAIFTFARQVWESSGGDEQDQWHLLTENPEGSAGVHRSLTLMESLAPREAGSMGYPPAHAFMADYWRSRAKQNDLSKGLILQHDAAANPDDLAATLRLAHFISRRGHHDVATRILNRFHAEPAAKIAKSVFATRSGETKSADRLLSEAINELQHQLDTHPADKAIRLQLSRALAGRGDLLDSMFVLAEGCQRKPDDELVDELIHRYTVWLSRITPDARPAQLDQLGRLLSTTVVSEATSLTLSSGDEISLPNPLVRLHMALLAGEGQWIVPFLSGTDQAARGNFEAARASLETALSVRPEQLEIVNNLAWVCLQLATTHSADGEESDSEFDEQAAPTSELMAKAWLLASQAVAGQPEALEFRQTRAAVALSLQKWEIAELDLKECISAGYDTDNARLMLAEAEHGKQLSATP